MANYTVLLSKDEATGIYTAVCPTLPGCVTQGKNRKTALEQIRQAMDEWGRIAAEEGILPLRDTEELVRTEEQELDNDRDQEGYGPLVERVQVEAKLPQPQRISLSPNLERLPVRAKSEHLTLLTIRALVRSVGMTYEEFLEQVLYGLADDDDEPAE